AGLVADVGDSQGLARLGDVGSGTAAALARLLQVGQRVLDLFRHLVAELRQLGGRGGDVRLSLFRPRAGEAGIPDRRGDVGDQAPGVPDLRESAHVGSVKVVGRGG